jgi:hypothetical protein
VLALGASCTTRHLLQLLRLRESRAQRDNLWPLECYKLCVACCGLYVIVITNQDSTSSPVVASMCPPRVLALGGLCARIACSAQGGAAARKAASCLIQASQAQGARATSLKHRAVSSLASHLGVDPKIVTKRTDNGSIAMDTPYSPDHRPLNTPARAQASHKPCPSLMTTVAPCKNGATQPPS